MFKYCICNCNQMICIFFKNSLTCIVMTTCKNLVKRTKTSKTNVFVFVFLLPSFYNSNTHTIIYIKLCHPLKLVKTIKGSKSTSLATTISFFMYCYCNKEGTERKEIWNWNISGIVKIWTNRVTHGYWLLRSKINRDLFDIISMKQMFYTKGLL